VGTPPPACACTPSALGWDRRARARWLCGATRAARRAPARAPLRPCG
jgi:hypothetical protein